MVTKLATPLVGVYFARGFRRGDTARSQAAQYHRFAVLFDVYNPKEGRALSRPGEVVKDDGGKSPHRCRGAAVRSFVGVRKARYGAQ